MAALQKVKFLSLLAEEGEKVQVRVNQQHTTFDPA